MENSSPSHGYLPAGKFRYPSSLAFARSGLAKLRFSPSFSICDIRIQKRMSRSFGKILFLQKLYTFHILSTKRSRSCESVPHFLTPKNSFAKTSSALFHHLPEYLEGRTPKKNILSFFKKNFTPAKSRKQGTFFFGVAEALRGSGGMIHSRSKKVRANDIMTPQLQKSARFLASDFCLWRRVRLRRTWRS